MALPQSPTASQSRFTLPARKDFSLQAAAAFARDFAPGRAGGHSAVLRLAFAADAPGSPTVGVELARGVGDHLEGSVTRADGRSVDGELLAAVRDQSRRILSLDVDGRGFAAIAERDPVVDALRRAHPGLRPVLFNSPYEAAAWAILSQRTRMQQAEALKALLASELGESVGFAGESLSAFPSPERLSTLPDRMPGLAGVKAERLRELAGAALAGELDASHLRTGDPDERLRDLQRLAGIGPFSAELILVRGAGDPDFFPAFESRVHRAMRAAYGVPADTGADRLHEIAERWRPYRSWVALLLRRSGTPLSGARPGPRGNRASGRSPASPPGRRP
jgi:DNA-3-methyladenine glycosylase II